MTQRLQYYLMFILLMLIVGSVIWGESARSKLFEDMKEFMAAGPRNNAYQGMALCKRVNQLDDKDIDCRRVYFGDGEQVKK